MAKRKREQPALTLPQFNLFLATLECKLRYYYPNEVHDSWSSVPWPNDHLYDSWELQLKAVGVEAVGFPWDTYEGFVVWKILSEPRRQTSWTELLIREGAITQTEMSQGAVD
jgi:hypothetical protein